MSSSRLRIAALLGLLTWVAILGCDSKPSVETSTAEGTVTGTVTIRGKPMNTGEITFNPANYQRKDAMIRTGKIGADGKFSVSTLIGQNAVKITGPAVTKEPALGYAGKTIEVTSGSNTLDIELPPK